MGAFALERTRKLLPNNIFTSVECIEHFKRNLCWIISRKIERGGIVTTDHHETMMRKKTRALREKSHCINYVNISALSKWADIETVSFQRADPVCNCGLRL